MSAKPTQPAECPIGEASCPWLDEVGELRGRVDRLEELVSHDSLTGLYNLRHLQEALPVVLERTRRSNRSASAIMLDIDHFKQINDTWGHEVGNLALKQVARILCRQVRIVDMVCRYGGEEFVIVLPDTGLRQAVLIAERIRRCIADTPVQHANGEFRMTASMGVEVHQPGEDHDPEAFIESADRLLYRAKESGRNRVCHRDYAEVGNETGVSQAEKEALRGLFTED